MIDWDAVRQDYKDGMSYSKLSKKYNISKSTISVRGRKEMWQEQRTLATNTEQKANTLCVVSAPQDAVSRKIADTAIRLLDLIYNSAEEGCDPSVVGSYSTALKNIQQTYSAVAGTQYLLDIEKIESIKRQYANVVDGDETGVIVLPEVDVDG